MSKILEFTFKSKVNEADSEELASCIAEHPFGPLRFDLFVYVLLLFEENIQLFLNVVKRVYSHVVGLTLFPFLLALG